MDSKLEKNASCSNNRIGNFEKLFENIWSKGPKCYGPIVTNCAYFTITVALSAHTHKAYIYMDNVTLRRYSCLAIPQTWALRVSQARNKCLTRSSSPYTSRF